MHKTHIVLLLDSSPYSWFKSILFLRLTEPLKSWWGTEWWYTPLIPATQEAETGGSWFEASLAKVSMRPYLKNKLKAKDWRCGSNGRVLTSLRPWVQIPSTAKKKKKDWNEYCKSTDMVDSDVLTEMKPMLHIIFVSLTSTTSFADFHHLLSIATAIITLT
jgi:hypothetical protein